MTRRPPRLVFLTTIIPNLQLKQRYQCLPEGRVERLTIRRLGSGFALHEAHRLAVGDVHGRQQLQPAHLTFTARNRSRR
jgi:hypothetical protein